MIELKNVSKTIEQQTILSDINLKLENGKIYGFVGRNGSGKTMLFRIICGLIFPTTGTVMINGIPLDNQVNIGNIGVMIEKPKFLPNITGFENLKLLASINNKITNQDIEETLKLLQLYENKDKKYHKYSLGMKQKLGIAQAIMEKPDIVILDEPFNGLDDSSVESLRSILKQLKQEKKTILIATHLKEDIEILCDEVYRLDGGKIVK